MRGGAYVYILVNRHRTVMYVGITRNVERRLIEHRTKAQGGFTAKYNVDRLVLVEEYPTAPEAIVREKQIKGWSRARKDALVSASNPDWNDLAPDRWPGDSSLRSE
ncbi:MAG: GIY-YIG nuclease family protein [Alphaproteobacteria bacterium]|nr:GIY-YIG nuclease family protein [Alphaproteobacteria bacterium]